MNKLRNCHDCGAKPGEIHQDGCDCKGHDKLFGKWEVIYPGKSDSDYLAIDLNEFHARGYNKIFFAK
jgi:hypothetical protein